MSVDIEHPRTRTTLIMVTICPKVANWEPTALVVEASTDDEDICRVVGRPTVLPSTRNNRLKVYICAVYLPETRGRATTYTVIVH